MEEALCHPNWVNDTNNIPPAANANKSLRDIDRTVLCWADTVHYQDNPIIVSHCQGEIVTDLQGRRYIDTQMWHSSCNFGYQNPEITKAVHRQLDNLPQVSGDFLHAEKLLLAQEVEAAIFARTGLHGRVSFNVGGTLVVEDALKIVRKQTGKSKVGAFMGAYHGRSLTVSGLSSSHRYRQEFGDFPHRAEFFAFPNPADCYYELPAEADQELGAFMLELCQGRGYAIPPRHFYQQFVPQLQERGLLIVDDEIQIGMFRTGKLFAFEHFGITPDIITLSKSFTNGLTPLSLVWAREELVNPDHYGPGHAHSNFANHSLGTAAALATWRYMLAQNYEQSLPEKGAYYLNKLRELRDKYWFIGAVDGLGLLLNMVFQRADGPPPGGARQAGCHPGPGA